MVLQKVRINYILTLLWCCILFVVHTNRNGEAAITQTNVFFNSQHVLAQIGHHQAVFEEIYKW